MSASDNPQDKFEQCDVGKSEDAGEVFHVKIRST